MLKKSLEVLAVTLPLALLPSQVYAEQPPYISQSKPPVYAQAEDLSTRLLKEADSIAEKRPHYAIVLYRRVMAEGGPLAEKAIEGAMQIYDKRLPFKDYDKWEVENALSFYNEVIQKHPNNHHVAKSHLKWGEIVCDLLSWIPEKIPEAMEKLEEAYRKGSPIIKAKARFKQGWTENLIAGTLDQFWDNDVYPILLNRYSDVRRADRRLLEVTRLAPQSKEARMARNLLEIHGVISK